MPDFVLSDFKWGDGVFGESGGVVEWSFASRVFDTGIFYDFVTPFIDPTFQTLVRDAFEVWENVANIDFVEVPNATSADVRIGWGTFDGPYGAIGEAAYQGYRDGFDTLYSISDAEIAFDIVEDWGTTKIVSGSKLNFYSVAIHEIGHVLGLGHTDNPETMMYPELQENLIELHPGDIQGAQIIYGPAAEPPVMLTTGDDTIDLLQQSGQRIDGLAGEDTALFSDHVSRALVVLNQDGSLSVQHKNGANGTDVLINFETLQFQDRTLDISDFSSARTLSAIDFTALAEMYVAYFNRAADAEGLFFWADKMAEGLSLSQIAEFFFDQPETRALYSNPSDTAAFVQAVYQNVLGRTPDVAGFQFWSDVLAAGDVSQGEFVREIILGAKRGSHELDIGYLATKADIGIYFSAILGMSDVADAQQVMQVFGDQATSDQLQAKLAVDAYYAAASDLEIGDLLFSLAGVVDDPFAVA